MPNEYYLITDISWLEGKEAWEGLKAIGMAKNRCVRNGKETEEIRYFPEKVIS